MKEYKVSKHEMNRSALFRAIAVFLGVGVNVALAYVSYQTGLPVYWDTIGTVVVAGIGGVFPGIAVAIASNLLCMLFNPNAAYFGIVNALVAFITVIFVKKRPLNNARNIIFCILTIGVISGLVSGLIQYIMFGKPQSDMITALLESWGITEGVGAVFAFLGINIVFNIFDKGICIGLAKLIWHVMPQKIGDAIANSGWRQKPLTDEERKTIDNWSDGIRLSARRRMLIIMVIMVVASSIITAWIGIRRYYENVKQERIEVATNAAKFAASVVDTSKVADYIKYGESVPGYKETEEMLYHIRDNAPGVSYLYVLKVGREGSTFIFDLDTDPKFEGYVAEDASGYEPGEFVPIEEAFEEYLDDMLEGKEIPPIESDDAWSWLVTVYYPMFDEEGNVVCYAGADVSINYLSDFVGDFANRVLVIMFGIMLLIIAYGMWTINYYTVYPLETLGLYIREFISAGDDQKKLDGVVDRFKDVDVRTHDEVEALYRDLTEMTINQTEQLRSIRRLSDSTLQMQDGLIITMADLVENRDENTGAHIQKTAAYVKIIVEGLKQKGYYADRITPKFMSDVVRSAPLHDVGKINIPDNVLNKPGKLTDEEFEIMKSHTTAGKQILDKAIDTVGGGNYLKEARNMAAYHHERWDGKGYPEGLHGEVIPLSARIMAVADVFDALTSSRVYKPAFSIEKALSIIEEGKGTQFDAKCVEVFMDNLPRVRVIHKKYSEEQF